MTAPAPWPGRLSLGLHWGVGAGVLGLIAFGFRLRIFGLTRRIG